MPPTSPAASDQWLSARPGLLPAPPTLAHAPKEGPSKPFPAKPCIFQVQAQVPSTPTRLPASQIPPLSPPAGAAQPPLAQHLLHQSSHRASGPPLYFGTTPALRDRGSRRPLRLHGACASPRADPHIIPECGHHTAESRPPWVQSRSWKTSVCPHSWKSRNTSANMVISANSCQNPRPPVKSEGAEPQKVKPATPQPLHSQLRTCCEDPMPLLTVCMETRREVRRVTIRYDSSFVTPAASLFPCMSEAAAAEDEPHSPDMDPHCPPGSPLQAKGWP